MAAAFARQAPAPSEARDVALAEMATAAIVLDATGLVEFANGQAGALLGFASDEGLSLAELFARCGVDGSIALPAEAGATATARLRLSDGRILNARSNRLSTGGIVLALDDVSAFVRDAELARHDPLTGLANRLSLHARMEQMLLADGTLALFCLDLDRFKSVNDTLGHPVGDALLRKVAERLLSLAGEGDVIARLGGDEFAILRAVARPEEAEALAARIVDLVGRTYVVEGHMMNIGASLGVALAPADGSDCDVLLKNADLALYRAKAEGRGRFRFFEPDMDARMQARHALELDLRKALALKELQLVYQPQIALETNAITGFEALVRWHNPRCGLVSPADFIPLAEEIGLMPAIGEWVLRTACREAAGWPRPVSIAVNLSPLQFADPKLVERIVSALAWSGLDPTRLELEITEGALLADTDAVVVMLHQVRALGIRVSMDDFGTGYSSLSYLSKFPFDKIKVDQSFIAGMLENAECGAIVRAVARLGASLGMKTTAEGVETEEQLAAIRAEGCTEVQGYLTGRPLPPAAAAALLASPPKDPA